MLYELIFKSCTNANKHYNINGSCSFLTRCGIPILYTIKILIFIIAITLHNICFRARMSVLVCLLRLSLIHI